MNEEEGKVGVEKKIKEESRKGKRRRKQSERGRERDVK